MNEKAATIVSSIEHATRHMKKESTYEAPPLDPEQPWEPHCSALFRETMRQISLRSGAVRPLKEQVPAFFTDESKDANTLGKRIRSQTPYWERVDLNEAQHLANQGALIVGSYINVNGHGHLGFVYPVELPHQGVMIRDGNIHPNATSTYGASSVEATFGRKILKKTQWFRYRYY